MDKVILAIRLRQLGDVLATLGALKSLKEWDPERRILFMIDACYHKLLANEDYIDELIPSPPDVKNAGDLLRFMRYVDRLRERRIDCVIDFHSNPRSAVLSFLADAPRRIGYDARIRKMFYTEIKPRALWRGKKRIPMTAAESAAGLALGVGARVERNFGLVELSLDGKAVLEARSMLHENGIESGAVGLNPGNPYQSKAWPDDYFVELAKALVSENRQVVIMWGPGEREKAERIRERAGRGTYILPELELADLPAVLRNFSMLVTIDSGLKHVAVCSGVPTLTFFGPTMPEEWHMGTDRDVFISLRLSCSPCRLLKCPFGSPCMKGITVEMAMNVIGSMLAGQNPKGKDGAF